MRSNMARADELAATEGLDYHFADGISGNTLLAHELLHLAAEHGTRNELKERLLHAYFQEQRSVFDVESLVPFAVEWGSTRPRSAKRSPSGATWAPFGRTAPRRKALGATGVPFFVVDRKYGAAGAQPAQLLLQILERAWDHASPHLIELARSGNRQSTVPAADGCTDDSCAV